MFYFNDTPELSFWQSLEKFHQISKFALNVAALLRWILGDDRKLKIKLRHLCIVSHYDISNLGCDKFRLNLKQSQEIASLITRVTTTTTIKSLYFEPLWIADDCVDFLRMWYDDPFGCCNIPKIVISRRKKGDSMDKNSTDDACRIKKRKMQYNRYVSVSQYVKRE